MLIFTFVWAFNQTADADAVEAYAKPFRERGCRVLFVELEASQEERLRRNETPFRLAEKKFRRDVVVSRACLLADDGEYQLNSSGTFDGRGDYLRLATTAMDAADAAERIIERFGIPRRPIRTIVA